MGQHIPKGIRTRRSRHAIFRPESWELQAGLVFLNHGKLLVESELGLYGIENFGIAVNKIIHSHSPVFTTI
jgi:hypothetical protein